MTGSLQEKNGKYYAILNYKDENGRHKKKWISTGLEVRGNKKRAEKRLRELIAEYESLDATQLGHKILLTECMKTWLALQQSQVDTNTYAIYAICLKNHLLPFFEPLNLDVREVTFKHIQRYFNEMALHGNQHISKREGAATGLSEESIKKHRTILNQTFQYVIKRRILQHNPVALTTIPKCRRTNEGRFYTVAEANRLLDCLTGEPTRPLVVFALYYGLRRSEILGLRWQSIDLENQRFYINHTVVKNITSDESAISVKDETKNDASNSSLPLLPDVSTPMIK